MRAAGTTRQFFMSSVSARLAFFVGDDRQFTLFGPDGTAR